MPACASPTRITPTCPCSCVHPARRCCGAARGGTCCAVLVFSVLRMPDLIPDRNARLVCSPGDRAHHALSSVCSDLIQCAPAGAGMGPALPWGLALPVRPPPQFPAHDFSHSPPTAPALRIDSAETTTSTSSSRLTLEPSGLNQAQIAQLQQDFMRLPHPALLQKCFHAHAVVSPERASPPTPLLHGPPLAFPVHPHSADPRPPAHLQANDLDLRHRPAHRQSQYEANSVGIYFAPQGLSQLDLQRRTSLSEPNFDARTAVQSSVLGAPPATLLSSTSSGSLPLTTSSSAFSSLRDDDGYRPQRPRMEPSPPHRHSQDHSISVSVEEANRRLDPDFAGNYANGRSLAQGAAKCCASCGTTEYVCPFWPLYRGD